MQKESLPTLSGSGVAHVIVDDLAVERLTHEDLHHLATVRRLKSGDRITLGDGNGKWRIAVLRPDGRSQQRNRVDIEFVSDVHVSANQEPPIVVGLCLPSLDRASWALQKMTELGVDRIHLLHSRFSSVREAGLERGGREFARLQRVIREAGMQSRSAFLPNLEPIMSIGDFPGMYPACGICTLGGNGSLELEVAVVVGPEGGFSESELELFANKIDLGHNVLRSETAAVAVSTVLSMKRAGLLGK